MLSIFNKKTQDDNDIKLQQLLLNRKLKELIGDNCSYELNPECIITDFEKT